MNEKDFLTSLDFSGINVFWKIMGKSEREEYPREAEWKGEEERPPIHHWH